MRPKTLIACVILLVASCSTESGSAKTASPPAITTTTAVAPTTATTSAAAAVATTSTGPPASTVSTTATPTTTEAPDTTPPVLVVDDPAPNAIVTEAAYRFSGSTEPGATVVAAGRNPADVADDGRWSIVLMLNPGGNVATLVAGDAGGNTTEVRVPIFLHACVDAARVAMAAGASEISTLTADLDGDREPDTVTSYLAGGRWRVHVKLAYGWESETDITRYVTDLPPPSPVRVVHLGPPAVLVKLGGNLVGASYGFVALAGCSLVPALGSTGDMPELWNGGGLYHYEFFVCGNDAVTEVTLGRGETSISVTETRYPFSGETMRFGQPIITEEDMPAPAPAEGAPDLAWQEALERNGETCVP